MSCPPKLPPSPLVQFSSMTERRFSRKETGGNFQIGPGPGPCRTRLGEVSGPGSPQGLQGSGIAARKKLRGAAPERDFVQGGTHRGGCPKRNVLRNFQPYRHNTRTIAYATAMVLIVSGAGGRLMSSHCLWHVAANTREAKSAGRPNSARTLLPTTTATVKDCGLLT